MDLFELMIQGGLASVEQVVIGLIFTAISVASAYYLNSTASKAARKANSDFGDPSTASQGAVIHWVHGTNRVPVVIAWVGERFQFVRRKNGSKGSKTKEGPFFTEGAWHQVCVGPSQGITRMWADDGLIFYPGLPVLIQGDDPGSGTPFIIPSEGLTPENCPSGTRLNIGALFYTSNGGPVPNSPAQAELVIQWGDDELAEPYGGLDGITGIESRFPRVTALRWYGFFLGTSPRWPQIDVEVTSYGPVSGTADPCSTDTVTVTGDAGDSLAPPEDPKAVSTVGTGPEDLVVTLTYTVVDEGWYQFSNERVDLRLDLFGSGTGNFFGQDAYAEITDGSETIVLLDEVVPDLSGITMSDPVEVDCWIGEYDGGREHYRRSLSRSYLYLTPGTWTLTLTVGVDLTGASPDRAEASLGEFTGILLNELENPVVTPVGGSVSFLRRILFGRFPQGLGVPEALIDLTSINTVEAALEAEGISEDIAATRGEKASEILSAWMADRGIVLTYDPLTGKDAFLLVREPTTYKEVPAGATGGVLPEIETYHGELSADRVVYAFRDEDREWRETVLEEDEDGHADQQGMAQAKKIDITTVADFASAAKIAQRRIQEELGNQVVYTFTLLRGATKLKPGDVIHMSTDVGVPELLRVLTLQRNEADNSVVVKATIDSYGVEEVVFSGEDGGGTSVDIGEAEIDPAFDFLEAPSDLIRVAGLPRPCVLVMRARASEAISFADVYISADGTNFDNFDRMNEAHFAGELTEEFPITSQWNVDQGPEVTALGPPDLDAIQDYTSDEGAWRRGAQVLVIGEEICFVRKLTPISGSTYRPDGILRACFDTEKATWPIGTKCYILSLEQAGVIDDPMIAPGTTLRVKTQPGTNYALTALDDTTAVEKLLEGKGVVPQRPTCLQVSEPLLGSSGYGTGDDVSFTWSYRNPVTPGSGAGHQGYGLPTVIDPIRGEFEVKVYDATDTLVRMEVVTFPEWTYANADLVSDLGGETNFTIEVRNIDGTAQSPAASLLVEVV